MDYKLIHLLFNPSGEITKKEYKQGIVLLILLGFVNYLNLGIDAGLISLSGTYGVSTLAKIKSLKLLTFPGLPIGFIMLLSSVSLSLKRGRDLGFNTWIGILFGFVVFTFFHFVFLSTVTYFSLSGFLGSSIEIEDSVKSFHVVVISVFFILGLLLLIFLLLKRGKSTDLSEIHKKGELTIFQLVNQLGTFITVLIVMLVFLGLIYFVLENDIVFAVLSSLFIFMLLCWYFVLVFFRLKNANKPFYMYLIGLLLYCFGLGIMIFVLLKSSNLNFINTITSVFSFTSFVFMLSNATLFVLPEKEGI